MLNDLRHLPDSFQLLTPDECVIIACCLAVYVMIFWPVLK